MKIGDVTSLGGKCPMCGSTDDWRIDQKQHIGEFNWALSLTCVHEQHYDPDEINGVGEIVVCNFKRDITESDEPEWEGSDDDL